MAKKSARQPAQTSAMVEQVAEGKPQTIESLLHDAAQVMAEHFRSWSYPGRSGWIMEGLEPSPFTATHWLTLNLTTRKLGAAMLPAVWPDVEAEIERAVEVHLTGTTHLFTAWWGEVHRPHAVDKRDARARIRRIYRLMVEIVIHALAEGELEAVAECRHTRRRFPLEAWTWRTGLLLPIVYGGVSLLHFKAHRHGFPPPPRDEERSTSVLPIDIWEVSLKGDAYVLLIARASVERFLRVEGWRRMLESEPPRGPGRPPDASTEELERVVVPQWEAGTWKRYDEVTAFIMQKWKMSERGARTARERVGICDKGERARSKQAWWQK